MDGFLNVCGTVHGWLSSFSFCCCLLFSCGSFRRAFDGGKHSGRFHSEARESEQHAAAHEPDERQERAKDGDIGQHAPHQAAAAHEAGQTGSVDGLGGARQRTRSGVHLLGVRFLILGLALLLIVPLVRGCQRGFPIVQHCPAAAPLASVGECGAQADSQSPRGGNAQAELEQLQSSHQQE